MRNRLIGSDFCFDALAYFIQILFLIVIEEHFPLKMPVIHQGEIIYILLIIVLVGGENAGVDVSLAVLLPGESVIVAHRVPL